MMLKSCVREIPTRVGQDKQNEGVITDLNKSAEDSKV